MTFSKVLSFASFTIIFFVSELIADSLQTGNSDETDTGVTPERS
jgi:hypothetical protein